MTEALFFQNVRIKTIKLICFAGKSNLSFELSEGTNVFSGHNCCGKTTLCDFIRFMLYGTDGNNNVFPWNGRQTVSGELMLIADGVLYRVFRAETAAGAQGENRCAITDKNGIPIETEKTPGEYFIGCSSYIYDRTVYLPQKQNNKLQTELTIETLDAWGEAFCGAKEMYSSCERALAERNSLMNEEKTGKIDVLLNERGKAELAQKELEQTKKKLEAEEESLRSYQAKMASNNKRMVIIKANMKNYTDDIKLMENAENAGSLKSEIIQNEKKLKLLSFEAQNLCEALTREEVAKLSGDYLDYSRLAAELSDAGAKLEIANENFKINQKLFSSEHTEDDIETASMTLESKRSFKNLFTSFGALFILIAAFAFCYMYFLLEKELIFSALIGGAVLIFSIILFVIASMFRKSANELLSSMNLETQADFDDLYETYANNKKSEDIYREEIKKAEDEYTRVASLAAEKLRAIRSIINAPRSGSASETTESPDAALSPEDPASEVLSRADDIIRAYTQVFEIEELISAQKKQYKELLSRDVQRETLEVSDEFRKLEKELSYITRQNAALFEIQTESEKKISFLRGRINEDASSAELSATGDTGVLDYLEEYRDVQLRCEALTKAISELEDKVTQPISARVNALISFALKSGESFILGEHFEFKYKRGSQTMMFSKAGGGLSEMALIALRVAFVEQLIKARVPMIFDESFTFIDNENTKKLCRMIEADGRQLFVFTSSDNDCSSYFKNARIFTNESFGSDTNE